MGPPKLCFIEGNFNFTLTKSKCSSKLKSVLNKIEMNRNTAVEDLSITFAGFPGGAAGKGSPADAGDVGSIPELGSSPKEGNGNPLQYSCLANPTDKGVWQAPAHTAEKESDMT